MSLLKSKLYVIQTSYIPRLKIFVIFNTLHCSFYRELDLAVESSKNLDCEREKMAQETERFHKELKVFKIIHQIPFCYELLL